MDEVKTPILEISHLSKSFGDHQVLKDIDFETYHSNVICIIGASGSGKSTLLRCINMTAFPLNFSSKDPVETYLTDICTVPVNIAGLPGVSIPCGFGNDGLPIGMQLIGNSFCEATILNAAYQYETAAGKTAFRAVDMGVQL